MSIRYALSSRAHLRYYYTVCVLCRNNTIASVITGSSSVWVKPKIIKLVCVAFPLITEHLGVRAKTGFLGRRIMRSNEAKCLPTYCCLSELAI